MEQHVSSRNEQFLQNDTNIETMDFPRRTHHQDNTKVVNAETEFFNPNTETCQETVSDNQR